MSNETSTETTIEETEQEKRARLAKERANLSSGGIGQLFKLIAAAGEAAQLEGDTVSAAASMMGSGRPPHVIGGNIATLMHAQFGLSPEQRRAWAHLSRSLIGGHAL